MTSLKQGKYSQKRFPRPVRTSTYLSMEISECGAASLKVILDYHKCSISLSKLREQCGVTRDGSNAANILKAGRSYGFNAKGFRYPIDLLKFVKPPFIVFWEFRHFLVVEGFKTNVVYINDPNFGRKKMSLGDFESSYSGIALLFEKNSDFKEISTTSNKNYIYRIIKEKLPTVTSAIVLSGFFIIFLRLIGFSFVQLFIDEILVESRQEWLRPLILSVLLLISVQSIAELVKFDLINQLHIRVLVYMKAQLMQKILSLPISFFNRRISGEINSRLEIIDKIIESIEALIENSISLTVVPVYAIVMLVANKLLFLTALTFAISIFISIKMLKRSRIEANVKLSQNLGQLAGASIVAIQSIETIKSSSLEHNIFTILTGIHSKTLIEKQKLSVLSILLSSAPKLLTLLSQVSIYLIGAYEVMNARISIGILVAYIAIFNEFIRPIHNLVGLEECFQFIEANLERLNDILNHQDIDNQKFAFVPSGNEEQNYSYLSNGSVQLKNVTFKHEELGKNIVENINLRIDAGTKVALVGNSGAGKTTLIKLISQIYVPSSGEVTFDNQKLTLQKLSRNIAVVDQDIILFEGTIRDNLTLWDLSISSENLIKACVDAEIYDFILSLPDGFNSKVNESGSNFSGGEKQRFEIARALSRSPKILILDEATSSLDTLTESKIMGNLSKRNCTCIAVAHRTSSIKNFDKFIVIDKGRVANISSKLNSEITISSNSLTIMSCYNNRKSVVDTINSDNGKKSLSFSNDAVNSYKKNNIHLYNESLSYLQSIFSPVSKRYSLNGNNLFVNSINYVSKLRDYNSCIDESNSLLLSNEDSKFNELDFYNVERFAFLNNIICRKVKIDINLHTFRGLLLATDAHSPSFPILLRSEEVREAIFYTEYGVFAKKINSINPSNISTFGYKFYKVFKNRQQKIWDVLSFSFNLARLDLQILIIITILMTMVAMILPLFLGFIISDIIPSKDLNFFYVISLILFVAAIMQSIFYFIQGSVVVRIQTFMSEGLQAAIFNRLLKVKPSFFKDFTLGDLSLRTLAINDIQDILSNATFSSILSAFFSLFNIVLMFWFSWQLAIVSLLIGICAFLLFSILGIHLVAIENREQIKRTNLNGFSIQLIRGIQKLYSTNSENRAFLKWSQLFSEQMKLFYSLREKQRFIIFLNDLLPTIGFCVILIFLEFIYGQGKENLAPQMQIITVGTFVAFNVSFLSFLGGFSQLSNLLPQITKIIPLWNLAIPVLSAPCESDSGLLQRIKLKGGIVFENISFSYSSLRPSILNDITFEVNPGEFVAIVGSTGSGKSTLLRLLLGFEQPSSGKIFLDGHDICHLDIRYVRQQMGVVLQNDTVLVGSIADCIACGRRLKKEEIYNVLDKVSLLEDVLAMPMGIDTIISESGRNISAGQKQRLMIARAIVNQPRLILLDEATSSLDSKSQQQVSKSLQGLGVTRIVIAHRLSTIINADRIYVIDSGRIVQVGNFAELQRIKGIFSQLVENQIE
jgi:ATP-binding cassette, subfamily C, bacterial